jgi:heptosyltransferase-2
MMERTMRAGFRHLVVRAPNWVGDVAMATPILEAAVADPRFERVTVAIRAHLAPLLRPGPCAPHVVALDREPESAALRALDADGIVLLTSSIGAAWRAFRAGIPLRAGAAGHGRGLLLTHRVVLPRVRKAPAGVLPRRPPIPTAHVLRDVAGLVGITVPSLRPRLHLTAEDARASRALLAERGLASDEGYAVACPGAAFGAAKLWPPERFAAALDALHASHGLRGVATGGPGEEPLIEAVAAAARTPVISLAGAPRDLHRLKPLVAGAELLLVGDSGPRWYAAAFEVPCVTVMGPNHPGLTATSLEWCTIARLENLECSPCMERTCPLGHHRCMQDLSVACVVAAAEELLERRARSPRAQPELWDERPASAGPGVRPAAGSASEGAPGA